jgi:hypothetical protein
MNYLFFTILFMLVSIGLQAQLTPYEKGNKNTTATYAEAIDFYKTLDKKSNKVLVKTMGSTDAGFPLHLVLVSNDATFDAAQWHKQNKTVLLINNGIHPGEPDGIDASMMLVRDIIKEAKLLPDNVCLAIIPVYNIGGCLNRSANFRVDQNGPTEFGFRGNAQNLDLNRDFIKSDSKEARSFAVIFHLLDPDIFIDNHVSNGADYQHIMTLLTTQHNKLGGEMGSYLHNKMQPAINSLMKDKMYDVVPYVNFYGETPEQGWTEFFDSPRYSSGYTTLWHTFGFVPETHMLKSYWQRVDATYTLMQSFIQYANKNGVEVQKQRNVDKQNSITATTFEVEWQVDTTKKSFIEFKGFTAGKKPSGISGLPRLYYDREKPFTKNIPFYNTYKATLEITKPKAYIIPQGWWKVLELLKINKVQMQVFAKDTIVEVEAYKILEYKSSSQPYENHHSNTNVKVEKTMQKIQYRKGDIYIPMNQLANRFLMETLEPQAKDSYFAWNFFDAILGQKEGISDYVFEDKAVEILKEYPAIKEKLEAKKLVDEKFAKNGTAQLEFIYKNSIYFEPAYMQYPVYRVLY